MIDVAKFVETLKGEPVAVLGLGISNKAVVKALVKAGAKVAAWDDNEENRKAAEGHLKDLAHEDMAKYACLVLAPGVSNDHPVALKAQEAGLEIICDLEILHRCAHGRKTIGVTGTNGKSTTTALIGHILNESGIRASVGGNIGHAALALAMPPKDGAFVLEISSFQAEISPTFTPDIAVHLNLTPDHLDRHGTMENYAAAKLKIFRGPGKAVMGVDDDFSKKMFEKIEKAGEREIVALSVGSERKNGVYVHNNALFDAQGEVTHKVAMLDDIPTLPGVHNQQNAAAAYAVARFMGLRPDTIMDAMRTFPGLPHRQFLVRTINGVAYVNDSKATNAAAAAKALACYKNVYWIAGGRPKAGGPKGLEPFVSHIRHAFLIGESMEEFASWLENHGVPHNLSGTLDVAVADAHRLAQSERGQPGGTGTVLLSPACASFDQFRNFEERGNIFTTLVDDLKEEAA